MMESYKDSDKDAVLKARLKIADLSSKFWAAEVTNMGEAVQPFAKVRVRGRTFYLSKILEKPSAMPNDYRLAILYTKAKDGLMLARLLYKSYTAEHPVIPAYVTSERGGVVRIFPRTDVRDRFAAEKFESPWGESSELDFAMRDHHPDALAESEPDSAEFSQDPSAGLRAASKFNSQLGLGMNVGEDVLQVLNHIYVWVVFGDSKETPRREDLRIRHVLTKKNVVEHGIPGKEGDVIHTGVPLITVKAGDAFSPEMEVAIMELSTHVVEARTIEQAYQDVFAKVKSLLTPTRLRKIANLSEDQFLNVRPINALIEKGGSLFVSLPSDEDLSRRDGSYCSNGQLTWQKQEASPAQEGVRSVETKGGRSFAGPRLGGHRFAAPRRTGNLPYEYSCPLCAELAPTLRNYHQLKNLVGSFTLDAARGIETKFQSPDWDGLLYTLDKQLSGKHFAGAMNTPLGRLSKYWRNVEGSATGSKSEVIFDIDLAKEEGQLCLVGDAKSELRRECMVLDLAKKADQGTVTWKGEVGEWEFKNSALVVTFSSSKMRRFEFGGEIEVVRILVLRAKGYENYMGKQRQRIEVVSNNLPPFRNTELILSERTP